MKQQFTLQILCKRAQSYSHGLPSAAKIIQSLSSIACRYAAKTALLLLSSMLATAAYAQHTADDGQRTLKPGTLSHLLHKQAYNGEYPLPNLPKAPESLRRVARDASGQPLNFPDRVWFPGEWEEVKAVCVSPLYFHLMPGHENDNRYEASPIVEGYGSYLYMENPKAKTDTIGYGAYISMLDIDSSYGIPFLYLMDGIQKAGAEAWVRIEAAADEQKIRSALESKGMRTDKLRFFISSGNAYWFRDCGPICFYYGDDDKLAMLDFFYGRNRSLDDLLPSVLHRQMDIPNYITDVVWEGGNCLVDGVGGLITSSAVYANNSYTYGPVVWDGIDYSTISYLDKPALSKDQVDEALSGMLGQEGYCVLTRLALDGGTGHVYLYADAIDENGFLFAQMPESYNTWGDYGVLSQNVDFMYDQKSFWDAKYYDMGRLPFPSLNDGSDFPDETEYGENYSRTYANHLLVNNYILQPCFSPVGEDGMPTADWDRANIEAMKKLYHGYTFYCVDMRTFDGSGGSIHCVTKQIPADNPIRILHMHLHGNVSMGDLTEVPFRAIITNKSGIKSAQLVYRVGDGEWQTSELTGNGNSWSGRVPVSSFTDGQQVDYYIQATSNNGKTITKPVNAAHGGYFSFTPDNTVAYNDDVFDFGTEPVDNDRITFVLNTKYLTEDTSTGTFTGVSEVRTASPSNFGDEWYTISGHRLTSKPTVSGIYLHQGKKVVIR